jgi:hypothetical protein
MQKVDNVENNSNLVYYLSLKHSLFEYYLKRCNVEAFIFLRSAKSVIFFNFATLDSLFRQANVNNAQWPIDRPTDGSTDWLTDRLAE